MPSYYLAIDIGASGGLHMLGWKSDGQIKLEEIYRFPNAPVRNDYSRNLPDKNNLMIPDEKDQLSWDIDALFTHILRGMELCAQKGKIPVSVGIDTWGVDFVLLDGGDQMMGNAVCYRDKRGSRAISAVEAVCSEQELYRRTGIQKQPFNTIYQLAAVQKENPELLENAESLMMIPDYLNFLLTGQKRQEYTNATTTGLVHAKRREWDRELLSRLEYPQKLFGSLSMPGETVGTLLPEIKNRVGYDCSVILTATHDTAGAFLAAETQTGEICLSSGTWSLLGVERKEPDVREICRTANFTNEGGYGFRYRFIKNIMGLWMLQSIRRELPGNPDYDTLQEEARKNSSFASIVDVNNEIFLAPADMTGAVRRLCRETNQPVPENTGQVLQCVYQSLADSYRAAIGQLQECTGDKYHTVRIVGGGSRDSYLNELTAKATGLYVHTGHAEASALGNLMAQMP
ncbi:MAG: rhamnulokinase [Oscillospiraceae bacterium]|nr:rhamnulokinase [Oscillospiraceae bacterium]